MMQVISLKEQLAEDTLLSDSESSRLLPFLTDGEEVNFWVRRSNDENQVCLLLKRRNDKVYAMSSYFIGVDWLHENEAAVEVFPKMNDRENNIEIDYLRILEDALKEPENYKHLDDLVVVHFDKPLVPLTNHHADFLSLFLITEFIHLLDAITAKGLKKSFYEVEENLKNKVKGKILMSKNVLKNLSRGYMTFNVCRYQTYDIDTIENRILKKTLLFCDGQLKMVYAHGLDVKHLQRKIAQLKPYFSEVGETVDINQIKNFSCNPIYREYHQAIKLAKLILRRYGYDFGACGRQQYKTPPFWIDCSKLFELYVFYHLRRVFTGSKELVYHKKIGKQEPDYLANAKGWHEPYIIDAKYKPYYKDDGLNKNDAWQVAGYSRLSRIYKYFDLNEETALPVKCLIVYPNQDEAETFEFNNEEEPQFDKISQYVRMYKVGIRLPEIRID